MHNGQALTGYVSQDLVAHVSPGEPEMYYQLVPQGDVLVIVEGPADALRSVPDAMSEKELQELLQRNSVPTLTASSLSGYLGSLQHLPAFDRYAPASVALEPGTSIPNQNKWRGSLGEVSAQQKGWLPQRNLNLNQPNHPIFDLRGSLGGLNSVKTSVRNPGARGELYETYLRGMADMLGVYRGKFARARTLLFPQLSAADGTSLMMRDGHISINQEHVEGFQSALKDPANYTKKSYWQLANQFLNEAPVRINGVAHRDYRALMALQQAPRTTDAVRKLIESALLNVRQQLASRVRSNGITGQHLSRLLSFRRQVALANPRMSPAQLRTWLFPELLMAARYGGGLRGNMSAAGLTGMRGAGGGAVVSMIFEGGRMLYSDWPSDAGLRLGKMGLAGGASGLTGGVTEQLVAGNMGSALARQLTIRGASSWVATGLGRGLGGAAGGGVAAPVFSMALLALDDQEHTATDYAAKGIRAAIPGTIAGALAVAASGAVVGSAVPGLGTAVGFIVGFVGYYVVDELIGDEVEEGVRHILK